MKKTKMKPLDEFAVQSREMPITKRLQLYCKHGYSIRDIAKAEQTRCDTISYLLKKFNLWPLRPGEAFINQIQTMLADKKYTMKQIAETLGLSRKTLYSYINNLNLRQGCKISIRETYRNNKKYLPPEPLQIEKDTI